MMMEKLKRIRINVTGIVQGVGFRPTVYRYASQFNLSGFVTNTPQGVTIEIEGFEDSIDRFTKKLCEEPPVLASITGFEAIDIESKNEDRFVILSNTNLGVKKTEISPDIASCHDCLREIFTDSDRRFLYPFTNCTNCGPRFSIIKDRPYDRKLTSMSEFTMCPDCQTEYNSPIDRRFHAQPNACPECGPILRIIGKGIYIDDVSKVITETIKLIKDGYIVAMKSIGGFNIACDPLNIETIKKLRINKNRPSKAFALMMKDIETAEKFCYVSEKEKEALLSAAAPIVLLRKKEHAFNHISPDNNYLGVILPYTPLHHVLFKHLDCLVMTSANRTDEPIATTDEEILELIKSDIVDFALTSNRDIINRCDDSIVQIVNDEVQIIRRSRGYVPSAIEVNNSLSTNNLSLGANLKNTFSIKKGNKIYMSQHIGDLADVRNYKFQKEEIEEFLKLFEFHPSNINSDAHPNYETYNDSNKKVYHHHAHALSAMGEHGLLGQKVTAVVCDGTGFGTDGNIWGFEFLEIERDYTKFKRICHLKYFPLPGGEQAVIEVDRIAHSITRHMPTEQQTDRYKTLDMLIEKNINSPLASSLGRLFDGVASLCGLIDKISYEAQAAMILQKTAENFTGKVTSRYSVRISASEEPNIKTLDYRSMIDEVVNDIDKGVSIQEVAYKFHLWVVDSIVAMLKEKQPEVAVFSGGCFQNKLLSSLLYKAMMEEKFTFFFNEKVPINDAGISFGQALP